jgi:hypothetical protein
VCLLFITCIVSALIFIKKRRIAIAIANAAKHKNKDSSSDKEGKKSFNIKVDDFTDTTVSDSWILTKESKHIDNPVIKISCGVDWKDQGFGNRKGQLKLVLMRKG